MIDVSALLRSVHHALKVPLSSIQNLTELMLLGIEGPMAPDIRQDVQDIAQEAARLSSLTEAVLSYLRLAYQALHLAPVDLSSVLQAHGLSLVTALPPITTDSGVLGEVVGRLVARLKYLSGDEPIQVTVKQDSRTLSLLFATRDSAAYQLSLETRPQAERHYLGELDLLFCHCALTRLGGALEWRHDPEGRVLYSIMLPFLP